MTLRASIINSKNFVLKSSNIRGINSNNNSIVGRSTIIVVAVGGKDFLIWTIFSTPSKSKVKE